MPGSTAKRHKGCSHGKALLFLLGVVLAVALLGQTSLHKDLLHRLFPAEAAANNNSSNNNSTRASTTPLSTDKDGKVFRKAARQRPQNDTSPEHPSLHDANNKQEQEHLPLLPWELESLRTPRLCQPPPGIPARCCLGSASSGGQIAFMKQACNKSQHVYNLVQRRAIHYLQQHPLDHHHAESPRCDACQVIDTLERRNWSLAFTGDSISFQTFVGLECELLRRGYRVTRSTVPYEPTDPTRWRYGIKQIVELRVSMQGGIVVSLRFYAMYRPNLDNGTTELQWMASNHDVLVFDHGLHYWNNPTDLALFVQDMAGLVQTVVPQLQLLLWRETTPQHFSRAGGHYRMRAEYRSCVPLVEPQSERWNVYAPALQRALASSSVALSDTDRNKVQVIPFRAFALELDALHPGAVRNDSSTNQPVFDCAHFCSTPYLWLPLWRHLRLELDRLP